MEYKTKQEATKFMAQWNGHVIRGSAIRIEYARQTEAKRKQVEEKIEEKKIIHRKTIIVRNLNPKTTEETLHASFSNSLFTRIPVFGEEGHSRR